MKITKHNAERLLSIVQFIGEHFAAGAQQVYGGALFGHDTVTLEQATLALLEDIDDDQH